MIPDARDDCALATLPARFAAELLGQRYGLGGEVVPLVSERDAIFRLGQRSGPRFILRISGRTEAAAGLELQCAMLAHIRAADPGLPVPGPVVARSGRFVEPFDYRDQPLEAAVFTYLEGSPVADVARSPAQRAALGVVLARLHMALRGFGWSRPAGNIWNMLNAHDLIGAAEALPRADMRAVSVDALRSFACLASPVLRALPFQPIHNDFNPRNILVDRARPAEITGIIDFGDIAMAPPIVDLAVAIARQVGEPDPLPQACDILGAYSAHRPLCADELEILYDLICTRLAMRITIWHHRLRTDRARLDLAAIDETAALLAVFQRTGRWASTRRFFAAAPGGQSI